MNSVATTPTVPPSTQNPKQPQQRQTAKEIVAANVQSLIEQLEAGHSDALHGLSRRDEPLSSLQLRECAGDRTTTPFSVESRGHVCVEPTSPPREEGRERHPHSSSHHRHQAQARRKRPRRTLPSRIPASLLDSAMPMSSTWSKPMESIYPQCAKSMATWAKTTTACFRSLSVRVSSLSLPRTSHPLSA